MLKRVVVPALLLLACTAGEGTETASQRFVNNTAISVEGGATQPIYTYSEAIKESVWVEAPMDSDGDGQNDRIAVEIVRPKTGAGQKVAIVMEASPYYRASPSSIKTAKSAGIQIPLGHRHWHDQFFVERGYATVEVEMQGTARSTGCPTTGAKADTDSIVAAVDWLNGRARAFYADGSEAIATWSTGAVGMMGLSYNGTLPIAVAARGTEGLKTIVPMGAISSWYDYTRDSGIAYDGWHSRYPEMLAGFVVSNAVQNTCRDRIKKLGDDAGDDTFDYTPFWQERDYKRDLDRIRASVFLVHGLRDGNVKPRQASRLWYGLAERNIPRKVWFHRQGHTDPVRVNPDAWKKVIHRWMDHWLYNIDNGVMNEPMASVQREDNSWADYASWPEPGVEQTKLHPGTNGSLTDTVQSGTMSLRDDPRQKEPALVKDPETPQTYRLAFMSEPLTKPVRLSGTPWAHVKVGTDATSTPVSVIVVDYGPQQVQQPEELSVDELMSMSCSLDDVERRVGCAAPRVEPFVQVVKQVVSHGSIDLKNHSSIAKPSALALGAMYDADIELHPADWIFQPGHRIGLVIAANNAGYVAVDSQARGLTVDLSSTEITLPLK